MSRHILAIAPDLEYTRKFPHADPEKTFSLTCPEGNGCSGWIECREPHEAGVYVSAEDGPYDCAEDAPWCDVDEFEFHGELHTWHGSHGWTVAYKGCVVAGSDIDFGDFHHLPYGRYAVEDEWDDDLCTLHLIEDDVGSEPIKPYSHDIQEQGYSGDG